MDKMAVIREKQTENKLRGPEMTPEKDGVGLMDKKGHCEADTQKPRY